MALPTELMLAKEEPFSGILGTLQYCVKAKLKQTFCDLYAEIK